MQDDALPSEIVEASRAARAASKALIHAADSDDPDGIEQAVSARGEAIARLAAALEHVPESQREALSRQVNEVMALDAEEARLALERARQRASSGLHEIGEKKRGVRGYKPAGNGSSSLDRDG